MTLNVTPASTFDERFSFLHEFGQKITFSFSLPVVCQVQQEKLFAFFVPLLIQWEKKLLITTWTRWFVVFPVVASAPSKKQVEDVNCKSLSQLQTFSSVFLQGNTRQERNCHPSHSLFLLLACFFASICHCCCHKLVLLWLALSREYLSTESFRKTCIAVI